LKFRFVGGIHNGDDFTVCNPNPPNMVRSVSRAEPEPEGAKLTRSCGAHFDTNVLATLRSITAAIVDRRVAHA
jgi:hypothetical protein